MEEKINTKAIAQYSAAFTQKAVERYFHSRDRISGPDLLTLTSSRQANLFTVHALMKAWKTESEKMRSPYFDYTAEPVRAALREFQNTLSNHISVDKTTLTPIVEKSVEKTLMVILDPYDFYAEMLDVDGKGFLRVEDLRSEIRYLKINSKPMELLLDKLKGKELVSGKEAFALLDQILEAVHFSPEEFDAHLAQLAEVLPLSAEQFFEVIPDPRKAKAAPKPSEPEKPVAAKPAESPRKTLADDLNRIQSLKESLTINQKFMFTKMLFKGDFEAFVTAVDFIDSCATFSEATQFVEKTYPDWDKESEEFAEFVELLEKRFS